jgi:sec-independent protein translocase protein TatA
MPGPSEWIIIAIVAIVVIFGAKKLPEMARSMGRAQGEFKKGLKEGAVDDEADSTQPTPPAQASSTPPAAPAAPPPPPPADQAPGTPNA